jgi:bifunctional non-homologous end joining protein LigD
VAGGRFVVQKHAARRLHYDVRLEIDGVLVSWAVPRGPSLDPADKRLAVHVEDHPLDYADFEGVIPAGNYGAGSVIVWDRGRYTAVEPMDGAIERGKLLFDLHGHKLRGRFTLVRSGKKGGPGNEWLLIKKPDGFADPGGRNPLDERSVLSGLEVDELATAGRRRAALGRKLARAGAVRRAVDPRRLDPMLAELVARPFSGDDWLFELKYDGFRLLASTAGGAPYLRYRSGRDATRRFPELALALRALPFDQLVLDGEVAALDDEGKTDFGRLQERAALQGDREIARATATNPVVYFAFDLLAVDGFDLRALPLERRKALLAEVVPKAGVIRYVDHVVGRGEELYRAVAERGLEGVVAKRRASPYRGERSSDWRKLRLARTDDFAVVGWSAPRGGRAGFGGLHLAARAGDGWRYAGKVGSGFDDATLVALRAALEKAPRARYKWRGLPGTPSTWVVPSLVVEVRYTAWNQHLRQPVFLRLRPDKRPEDCTVAAVAAAADDGEPPEPALPAAPRRAGRRAVVLSNLDKPFWPDDGYTKGDLVAYYRDIAPLLLPYLADRPLVLTRFPDGIGGKSFYQKDAPTWAPDWLRTHTVWSEHAERDVHYFVVDEVDALLYLVNLGTIPLHVWSSRASDLARPDWCILDLDPKGAPLSDVVALALAIRRLCDELGLPTRVKTSGQAGLHVLIPLGRQLTHEQSRQLAGLLAQRIELAHGDIATMARVIERRRGKVYLDWLQNRHGQLLVAPLSVRPVPGATVSMPLRWREVGPRLDPTAFTIRTARRRLDRLGVDPMADVLTEVPDLLGALGRLGEQIAAGNSGRKRK